MRSFVKHILNILLLVSMAACLEYENFDGVMWQSTLPTLSTHVPSNITATSAVSGGTILSDGGSPVIERGICWDYSRNPTINTVYKTEEGGGTGEFTSTMTGLPPHTKVYVRAYATNANGTGYGNEQVFNTEAEEFGTLTDIDNNTYRTMEVGAQIWMVENLKTTRFSNGDEISYLADNTDWTSYALAGWPASCSVNNSSSNDYEYGRLYNWYAVNDGRKLCPNGWKVPTHEDWAALADLLGGESVAGGKLKETGTAHWIAPNVGATDDIRFSALPAGFRNQEEGVFLNLGYRAYFWSSNGWDDEWARMRYIDHDSTWFRGNFVGKKGGGYSVRCIKDESTSIQISTVAAYSITYISAKSGGRITSDGGSAVTARGVCWNNYGYPTTGDNKTEDGTGTGEYTSNLTGLQPNTTYYIRAYATNAYGTVYGDELSFTTPAPQYGSISDIDGNSYKTVIIGDCTWMVENLRTTRFVTGEAIPEISDQAEWSTYDSQTLPAACNVENDAGYVSVYGKLYNWHAVDDDRKLCPEGWEIPSHDDWVSLMDYLGGEALAGGRLKEAGTSHWAEPNTGATNDSYFSALPAGYRMSDGNFSSLGFGAYFWTSDEYESPTARLVYMDKDNASFFHKYIVGKGYGFSVRCIKDDDEGEDLDTQDEHDW